MLNFLGHLHIITSRHCLPKLKLIILSILKGPMRQKKLDHLEAHLRRRKSRHEKPISGTYA